MDEKSIQYFLQVCTRIEETVGEIYRQFARSAGCDAKLQAIWARLAAEEDDHAVELRFASRLPARQTFRDATLNTARVEQLLARARSILQGAQKSRLSVEEALRVSIALEKEFLEVHVATVAVFAEARMEKLFRSLGRGDDEHTSALKVYLAEHLGGRAAAL